MDWYTADLILNGKHYHYSGLTDTWTVRDIKEHKV